MKQYKCSGNTLLHSILFNIPRLESIMRYGIISKEFASKNNIEYAKNFDGANLDDCISLVRYLYVNYNEEDSSYCIYVKNGITFIVEDVNFIYDKSDRIIHRFDEVLVEDHISKDKIKGIMIPKDYEDSCLSELDIISPNMKNYLNVKNCADYIVKYLKNNNYQIDYEYYNICLKALKSINNEIYRLKLMNIPLEDNKYQDLLINFEEVIKDLNIFLAEELDNYFCILFNKDNVTILEIVDYFNKKYLNVELYCLPSDRLVRNR